MKDSYIVGVDIGGSHITAALVDIGTRKIVEESYIRQMVNAAAGVDEIIAAWSEVISRAMYVQEGVEKIGIAMPGPFDYENGICLIKGQDKYEMLYQQNVKELLAAELRISSNNIHMMNDAGCFLQGEVFGGAAQGVPSAIGITLGTGLGSARYEHGLASDADLWCLPFKNSIAEDYLSTRWFVKRYRELSGIAVNNVKELVGLPETAPFRQVVFDEFGENLAHFLTAFIAASHQPEMVVAGGNIALAADLFMPSANEHLTKLGIQIPIRPALLGESAPIFGAAGYWLEAMKRKRMMSS
jgi:glucokinase